MRQTALLAILVLVMAACSGPDEPATGDTAPDGTSSASTTSSAVESTPTTSPTTTTAVPAQPFVRGLDVATIGQLTPTEGNERRPLLQWEPVDGAERYTVLVKTADGRPWWSWGGTETEVILGGVDTDAVIGGPVAGTGVTWVVYAFDADNRLVGVSALRPVGD